MKVLFALRALLKGRGAKRRGFAVLLLCTMAFLPLSVRALAAPDTQSQVQDELGQAAGVDQIEGHAPPEVSEILGDSGVQNVSLDGALGQIGTYLKGQFFGVFQTGLKSAALILAVVVLCGVAESMLDTESAVGPNFVPLGGALAIAAVSAGDLTAFVGLGANTLTTLSDFSKVLLPSLAASATAAGALSSGSVKYLATALFFNLLISAARSVILPLVYAYIAAVIANAALGGSALDGAVRLLRWLCVTLLTLLVLAFTLYLTLSGAISGSTDQVTAKLAKTTISAALPVVGGILSDAAGSLVAGASLLRNAIGIFGLLAVLCVCLLPFLRLGVHYLLYKATAGLAGALSSPRLTGLISGLGTAFGLVMGLLGAGAAILFLSILSSLKGFGLA